MNYVCLLGLGIDSGNMRVIVSYCYRVFFVMDVIDSKDWSCCIGDWLVGDGRYFFRLN